MFAVVPQNVIAALAQSRAGATYNVVPLQWLGGHAAHADRTSAGEVSDRNGLNQPARITDPTGVVDDETLPDVNSVMLVTQAIDDQLRTWFQTLGANRARFPAAHSEHRSETQHDNLV
jgi:hypothetical protein